MSGAAVVHREDRNIVTVSLICISCGAVEEIHVFEERKLPGKMYWECLSCQEGKYPGGPDADIRH